MGRIVGAVLGVLVLLSLVVALAPAATAQQAPKGPWVDEIVFQMDAPAIGIERLIAGEIDWWHDTIEDPEQFKRMQDAGLPYTVSYGNYYELTFNTVCNTTETGEIITPVFPKPSINPNPEVSGKILFNPFCSRRIREAMHWLVNREFLAEQVFGGLAVPRYTAITPNFPDYGRFYDVIMEIEEYYKYNFEKARSVIFEEMLRLGATLEAGVWKYKGEKVYIIFLIRTEDLRRQIGDYVSSQLEQLGFTVIRHYGDARALARYWLLADPAEGPFHIYTGGWITTVVARDQSSNFGFFYTKLGMARPLWQSYINTPEFYDVAEKLYYLKFTSIEERNELMKKALWLSMKEENQRIFLVNRIGIYPMRPYVQVASDLSGGVSGAWLWPYTIRIKDKVGGTLRASMRNILVEPWNPVGGTNWIFDQTIIRALGESAVLPDPYSGLYLPHRVQKAEVYVKKGLPVTKTLDWVTLSFVDEIKVPEDALLLYDCQAKKIRTVGEVKANATLVEALFGIKGYDPKTLENATAKVVVYYDPRILTGEYKWHDGSPFDLADMIYAFIIAFDRACSGSPLYDEGVVPSFRAWFPTFKGIKIVSTSPLVIEYYTDTWYLDAEWIAADGATVIWPYYSYGPGAWHVLELGAMAERGGKLAFSAAKATKLKVDQVNLIGGASLKILSDYLDWAIANKYVPYKEVLSAYITEDKALARWRNLKSWYDKYGHFMIGLGPFYLYKVDYAAKTVTIRANREYIDTADRYAGLAAPPTPALTIEAPPRIVPGFGAEIGIRVATPTGEPYKLAYMEFVRYIMVYPGGKLTGLAEPVRDGYYRITLDPETTAALPAGPIEVTLIAVSRLVGVPTIKKDYITIAPVTEYIAEMIGRVRLEIEGVKRDLQTQISEVRGMIKPEEVEKLRSEVESLRTMVTASIAVAVLAIIAAIVAFILARRGKPA